MANPCLIKLEPGKYDLGTSPLRMKAFVDIEGSGEGVTILTAQVEGSATGTVEGASNAALRFLSVINNGAGLKNTVALYLPAGFYRLSDFGAFAFGGTSSNVGISVGGVTNTVLLQKVTILASASLSSAEASGLLVAGDPSVTLRDVTISAISGGLKAGTGVGIRYVDDGTVDVHHSTIEGNGNSVLLTDASVGQVRVGASKLDGPANNASAKGAVLVCAFSYSQTFVQLGTTCK